MILVTTILLGPGLVPIPYPRGVSNDGGRQPEGKSSLYSKPRSPRSRWQYIGCVSTPGTLSAPLPVL